MSILPLDPPPASAAALPGLARQQLALDALRGVSISQIAQDQHVSRKFVYQQLHQAETNICVVFNYQYLFLHRISPLHSEAPPE